MEAGNSQKSIKSLNGKPEELANQDQRSPKSPINSEESNKKDFERICIAKQSQMSEKSTEESKMCLVTKQDHQQAESNPENPLQRIGKKDIRVSSGNKAGEECKNDGTKLKKRSKKTKNDHDLSEYFYKTKDRSENQKEGNAFKENGHHQKQEGHCEKENQDGRDQNQEDRNQGGKKHVEAFSAQKDKTHEEEEQKQESTCPGTEEKTETGTQAKKEKAQSTRCNVCQKTKSLVPCKTCRRSFHAKCVGFNKRSEMPKKFKCSHCRYSLFFTIGDLLP